MSKTAPIPDDVHALIIDKQTELKRKYKISVKISDIIAVVMKNNIHKIGKYLGLKNDEGSDVKNNIRQDIINPDKPNVKITERLEVEEDGVKGDNYH